MPKILTSVPVLALVWIWFTAGILVEVNRFYPDILFHP